MNDKPAAIVCTRRGLLAALTLLLLAACGRRGRPEPPPAADPAYPRAYPTK